MRQQNTALNKGERARGSYYITSVEPVSESSSAQDSFTFSDFSSNGVKSFRVDRDGVGGNVIVDFISSNGTLISSERYDCGVEYPSRNQVSYVAPNGEVYAPDPQTPGSSVNYFGLTKFNSDGTIAWQKRYTVNIPTTGFRESTVYYIALNGSTLIVRLLFSISAAEGGSDTRSFCTVLINPSNGAIIRDIRTDHALINNLTPTGGPMQSKLLDFNRSTDFYIAGGVINTNATCSAISRVNVASPSTSVWTARKLPFTSSTQNIYPIWINTYNSLLYCAHIVNPGAGETFLYIDRLNITTGAVDGTFLNINLSTSYPSSFRTPSFYQDPSTGTIYIAFPVFDSFLFRTTSIDFFAINPTTYSISSIGTLIASPSLAQNNFSKIDFSVIGNELIISGIIGLTYSLLDFNYTVNNQTIPVRFSELTWTTSTRTLLTSTTSYSTSVITTNQIIGSRVSTVTDVETFTRESNFVDTSLRLIE